MSSGLWKTLSASIALVDSELPGSHDEDWLSWTWLSFVAKPLVRSSTRIQRARTSHFVRGPVSRPAMRWCMLQPFQVAPTAAIREIPEARRQIAVRSLEGVRNRSGGPKMSKVLFSRALNDALKIVAFASMLFLLVVLRVH